VPGGEGGLGAGQRLAVADDAHLVPHEGLEGISGEGRRPSTGLRAGLGGGGRREIDGVGDGLGPD
jgi:hypothetical protein